MKQDLTKGHSTVLECPFFMAFSNVSRHRHEFQNNKINRQTDDQPQLSQLVVV
ncbi:hypothetical protein [Sunxiuqinia dokdonensis]|uniref:Uncharacterized protein n=1 Tax=Sunxiuqinia dokdonensis TaxID=1409788 RepID=A0A0L8VB17_9BACT|nr:hypothetical protein [Sunxiuqinia dokdonensis]KOH45641.1 hypothetical protein NC99_15330 [Sunxiuqinia dokdonensis]